MKLSNEEVRKIADLAKLELSDEEVGRYAEQLSTILDYFQRLQAVDTSQIEPTASVLPLKNVMRGDEPGEPLPPDKVIANAPRSFADQFRVSRVLDTD